MINIDKSELYIKNIASVMKSYITPRFIDFCRPRLFDGFIYIMSGSCTYVFREGYSFTATEGDVMYLAKDAVYSMDVHEKYDFTVVDFYFDSDKTRKSAIYTPADRSDTDSTFGKLLRRYRRMSEGYFADCLSLTYRIYASIIKSVSAEYLNSSTRYKLEEARQAIHQGFQSQALTVSSLAESAEMSETYFRKLFKAGYGTSPSEYITGCRISYAKELLRLDYLSISDIAESCGFSSSSYFCRVFKKHTGTTPASLCKENR